MKRWTKQLGPGRARQKLDSLAVTMRSLRVLRESGLSGGPREGMRSFLSAKKYGPFAGVIERLNGGDVGHFDGTGRLYVDGRDDDMIISGGENVYPLEVENLIGGYPDADEVAVVGVPDPDFEQRLKACVVLSEGPSVDAAEIKDYVRVNLARYKVPREVEFRDELPRNATGKLLRSRLECGAVK